MVTSSKRSEVALILAGGEGTRMIGSGVSIPKPLVPVADLTLLETNVRLLLHWGFRDIVVAISALPSGSAIDRVCRRQLTGLVRGAGGQLQVLTEPHPLGNIGGAGMLAGSADTVLAVYADNVTALDLGDLMESHRHSGWALTVASHELAVTLPYGQIRAEEGRLVDYAEKPTLRIPVASGVNVLGADALAAIPSDRPTGFSDLANDLVAHGLPVGVYRHEADWVDVNEAKSIPAAEAILVKHRSLLSW